MSISIEKAIKNRGIERNKKPLQNIVYKVELAQLKEGTDPERYKSYLFKDLGYLVLNWNYQKDYNKHNCMNWHGFITPEVLKEKLGDKQWAKFCSGKREFVVQRREDGKNKKKGITP